jgi:hypothetical protein
LRGFALLPAVIYALATEALVRREPRLGLMAPSARTVRDRHALTFALEKEWITIAIALMAPGAARVAKNGR